MLGVKVTRSRAVVSIPALAMFLREFKAGCMIRALIDLTEFAVDHPDFGTRGKPGSYSYLWADEATDLLIELLEDDCCVEEFPEGGEPFILDSARQTITIYFGKEWPAAPQRHPPPEEWIDVPLRLMPDAPPSTSPTDPVDPLPPSA